MSNHIHVHIHRGRDESTSVVPREVTVQRAKRRLDRSYENRDGTDFLSTQSTTAPSVVEQGIEKKRREEAARAKLLGARRERQAAKDSGSDYHESEAKTHRESEAKHRAAAEAIGDPKRPSERAKKFDHVRAAGAHAYAAELHEHGAKYPDSVDKDSLGHAKAAANRGTARVADRRGRDLKEESSSGRWAVVNNQKNGKSVVVKNHRGEVHFDRAGAEAHRDSHKKMNPHLDLDVVPHSGSVAKEPISAATRSRMNALRRR